MAQTICSYKCLFYVIVLQILFKWNVTAVEQHHQSQKLSESGRLPELQDASFLDADLKIPSNVSDVVEDHHVYYNSSFYSNPAVALSYWIDLKNISEEKVNIHQLLSEHHRRAAGVSLSFDFPFYGHLLRNITIATGGFLYMGDYIHSWIAATQYIAPLMANFDPSINDSSKIQYYDNGTAFTVQWDHVLLQERSKDGSFTFQTTLLQNGDIIFVYKEIPIPINEISNESHPVKVGCSDAYVMERSSLVLRKKIIYEYHRVDQMNQEISNNTVLYLTALPTCLKYKDCESCQNSDIGFNCTWCEALGKCSDGLNRHRQEWLRLQCSEVNDTCLSAQSSVAPPAVHNTTVIMQNKTSVITNSTAVPLTTPESSSVITKLTSPSPISANQSIQTTAIASPSSTASSSSDNIIDNPVSDSRKTNEEYVSRQESGVGAGGIFAIVLVVTLALGIGIWTFYAYKNPHSSSGQFLIKYRPSQWHWKTEESRYSASVHM